MSAPREESRPVSAQATEWLVTLAEGDAQDEQAFWAWARQSPRHVEEFLLATAAWNALRQEGHSNPIGIDAIVKELKAARLVDNIVTLPEPRSGHRNVGNRKRILRSSTHRWTVAAALTAVVIAAAWYLSLSSSRYATQVGEQRTVRLSDGSVLYLNTASRAHVRYTDEARKIELIEGEALFVVAHDRSRPFRVTAGNMHVQAVGTQFNVRRRGDETRVSVIEGTVKVAEAANLLTAGKEASLASDGRIVERRTPDVSRSISWRERRLVFRTERLEDVVAEINLYGPRHFTVDGPLARETRLTATFDVDKPDALATFLQKYSGLEVLAVGDDFVIRDR